MSQAALLLCVGAAVAAETAYVPRDEGRFALPTLEPMEHPEPIPLARAVRKLDVSPAAYVRGFDAEISSDVAARLTHELYADPDVDTAAALVEAGLHSRYRVVRTAAAVAALDTTGPREDVIRVLEASAQAEDIDIRELARTGLARAQPNHPLLNRYVHGRRNIEERDEPSNTAVISHGTWAASAQWWRSGGDFYEYLDAITPSLHVHDESFGWSGDYSHAQRSVAADELIAWVGAQQLNRPDYFAHSHGGTVANLATQRGLNLSRLVLMGYPVHNEWLPVVGRVTKILDVRMHFDLVILADRGGQRLPASLRNNPKVTEERNGWFSHSATHEPSYWEEHGLPARL